MTFRNPSFDEQGAGVVPSLIPFSVTRPLDVPRPKFHKSVNRRIQQLISADVLPNVLFSATEASFIRSQPLDDSCLSAISNSPDESVVFTFNQLLLQGRAPGEISAAVASAGIDWMIWLHPDVPFQIRSLALNVFALCFDGLELENRVLFQIFELCAKTISGLAVQCSLTKKLCLVLLLITAKLANISSLSDPVLSYSIPQFPVVSSAIDSPLAVQFLLLGRLPQAYEQGDDLIKRHTYNEELIQYITTNEFQSASRNSVGRDLLTAIAPILPSFIQHLSKVVKSSNRAISATPSQFDLAYLNHPESITAVDIDRERDLTVLAVWSFVHCLSSLFSQSNAMDGEILKHFLLADVPGKQALNLPATAFQSFLGDLRPQLLSSVPSASLPFPNLSRGPRNPFAIAIAMGLHISTDLIQYTPALIHRFVTKRVFKAIMDHTADRAITREGSYVGSKFLRFVALDLRADLRPPAKLIASVYTNLEQFEMFERWTGNLKADVAPVQTPAVHLTNLKRHAEAIGLNDLFP
jgi:hypothetical protein